MVVLSRLGVTFKVGLLALAAGAPIAACGFITVIDPDGGAGSGGAIGGGSGGSHGGGTGGSGLSDGGAMGGRNGGGTGGSNGGGTGGTVGGTGGRLGGSGGVVGGSGGIIGGSGGRPIGSGGTTGSGGGTGNTCTDIKNNFAAALAEARTCTAISGCPALTNDQIECGCPTSVSHSDRVDSYRQAWFQSGCSSGVCPAIFCIAVTGGTCSVSTGGTGMCVNSGVGMP